MITSAAGSQLELDMPYTIRKVGGKYRIAKPGGKLAGVDGSGHATREKAAKQIAAIMASEGARSAGAHRNRKKKAT